MSQKYKRRHGLRLYHCASSKPRLSPLNEHVYELQKIYDQPLMVGNLQQATGLSNVGDTRRLERFMQKLLKGA